MKRTDGQTDGQTLGRCFPLSTLDATSIITRKVGVMLPYLRRTKAAVVGEIDEVVESDSSVGR